MTAWALGGAHLLALGLSDEVPRSLGKTIAGLEILIPSGLGVLWIWYCIAKGLRREAARQARVSAKFRTRWPADRIWQAPYAELEAEIFSCWQLLIVLESRNACRKPGATAEECDRQIVALRAWVSTLLDPFNAAAVREQRILA